MSKWYSPSLLLSHNAVISCCLSGRGMGKSFSAKKLVIDEFIQDGTQFIYTRRFKNELIEMKDTYFNDIAEHYPNNDFEVKGFEAYINGKLAGYFIPLSTSSQLKSASFPNVKRIIFDEYVITSSSYIRYLKNEMTLLFDLIETVFRLRRARVLLLANSVSFVNPLFDFYKIQPKHDQRFIKAQNNMVCIEIYHNETFTTDKLKTDFAKLIEGTEYEKYAIGNNTLEDNNDFITPRPSGRHWYICSIRVGDNVVGVWEDFVTSCVHVDEIIDTSSTERYFIFNEDARPNEYSLKSERKSFRIKTMRKAARESNVYFTSQKIKKIWQQTIARYL